MACVDSLFSGIGNFILMRVLVPDVPVSAF
jgi:hypothetical protein